MNKTNTESQGKALRPKARIMQTLGEELISSESVAVIELVKNAYDADAGYVLIRFNGVLKQGLGGISIEDDGHGMSIQTVETSWMEPATSHKKKEKKSKFLNRRLLGEKGVGRFASSRLARELELITRSVGNSQEVYAFFDWSQFDNDDAYLDEVLILTEERDPEEIVSGRSCPKDVPASICGLPRDGSHGTILRMSGLKRAWEKRDIDNLKRSLSRLISPFERDNGFKIFLHVLDENIEAPQELEPPNIIKYPHYTLVGDIDEKGNFKFIVDLHAIGSSESFIGKLVRENNDDSKLIEIPIFESFDDTSGLVCGAFSFKILVWDRDQLDSIDQKLGVGIRAIRKDLDSIAGVSIFRDGFRVLPYGEPENDWLKLDIRRVQNPTFRLSNNQITGYIKIKADDNPMLKDQSNREGLDNNQGYLDLQDVVKLALSKLEGLRFKEKSKDNKTSSKMKDDTSLLSIPDTSELRLKISNSSVGPETLELFDATTKAWEEQVVRIRTVLSRYHSLATMGQLVDKVIHDGRQPLSTIQTQSSLLLDFISKALKKDSDDSHTMLSNINQRLLKIRDAANLIDLVLKRIEPLGGRRSGRPTKVYLNEVINSAFSHFQHDIAKFAINVTLPNNDELVQVDSLELQEVLINLISNSIYWLTQVPKERRSIIVQCIRPIPGEIDIIFADSGPGIPNSNKSSIFEPYFTTKPDGVGLGLVIAGEVIKEYYDGSLELLNSGPLPGAVFRIKIRKRV
ncbi:sensor histidine kinase [Pectobacterium punjabense]|uniref:sensor histidine kinase n=1 Tax=Pectobacterium punjabense TaxID=2108399 RepID=UPI0024076520|nr:ATP-binding protein [Pectobacterium punjabense]MDG0796044.1 ATP-binding protein [Pectobacterium punjabense]